MCRIHHAESIILRQIHIDFGKTENLYNILKLVVMYNKMLNYYRNYIIIPVKKRLSYVLSIPAVPFSFG